MSSLEVKLTQGIHVMHLFYNVDRAFLEPSSEESQAALKAFAALCEANSAACQPRICTYGILGGKADFGVILYAADGYQLGKMHRELEACFPGGALQRVYDYVSITEISEYSSTEEDYKQMLIRGEKLEPGTEAFDQRFAQMLEKKKEYEHYRLNPELPDWEVMCFYPMNKRREGTDNWYSLDFDARKKLMGGHARVGRKYGGRVTQLITSSTGIDDWEWGVTLVAHQLDALRDIVYEMRFDEVSARFGEFGTFYTGMRLSPEQVWEYLKL